MKANRLISLALVASLAACATPRPAPPAAPAPVVRPAPPPAPPPTADWRDLPQSPGDWRFDPAQGSAAFGIPGVPQLTVGCSAAARRVTLTRTAPAPGAALLVITTTSQRRVLAAVPATTGSAVTIPARDGILDAMAFSRGRFMVEAPGMPALLVPSWPELSRVVEDCRG